MPRFTDLELAAANALTRNILKAIGPRSKRPNRQPDCCPPQVAERIGEFQTLKAAAQGLMDKLVPMYQTVLAGGDAETVLQVVELQARIAGLISGGSILLQRAGGGARQGSAPRMPARAIWNSSGCWTKKLLRRRRRQMPRECT